MFNYENPREFVRTSAERDVPSLGDMVLMTLASARQHVLWVVFAGALGLFSAAVFSVLMPPSYLATAEILVNPIDLNLVENDLSRPTETADSGATTSETQTKILTSDSVLSRVVTSLRLDQNPVFLKTSHLGGSILKEMVALLGDHAAAGAVSADRVALDELRQSVTVKRTERTFVIDISAKSRDPALSADIANGVAQQYLADKADARAEFAQRAAAAFDANLKPMQDAVRTADDAVVAFRTQHRLIGGNGGLVTDQQIGETTTALGKAHETTEQAKARYQQMQAANGIDGQDSLPDVLQSTELQQLRQTLDGLRRRQAEMGGHLGPLHPSMIDLAANIAQTERAIKTQIGRLVASAKKDYERAATAERATGAQLDALRTQASDNATANVTLRQLQADLDAKRSIYDAYLRRAKETSEQGRIDATNARVITAAQAPIKRSFPPPPLILLPLGLAGGLALGLAICAILPLGLGRMLAPPTRPSPVYADNELPRGPRTGRVTP